MPYGRVEDSYWDNSRDFSRQARELGVYLLTSRHRSRTGLFVMDPMYAAADLRCEDYSPSPKDVERSLGELEQVEMIVYEPVTRMVWIRRFLVHNPMQNPPVVASAISHLKTLPDSPLLRSLHTAVLTADRPHYKPLVLALAKRVKHFEKQNTETGSAPPVNEVVNGAVNEPVKESRKKKSRRTKPEDEPF